MMKQQILWKRCWSVVLALALLALSVSCVGAVNSAYPGDINQSQAVAAASRSDTLVKNAVKAFTGKDLAGTIYATLYQDETLSTILLSVYDSAGEQGTALSALGLDLTPPAVAAHLRAYPAVASRLAKSETWSDVDLDGAAWNVRSKAGFSAAVSAMLAPLNDVLYMLLCGGTVRVGLLPIVGDQGYANGAVPILQALGCEQIVSVATFTSQAASDRSTMVKNILSALYSLLDAVSAAPVAKLTRVLPGLAIFIRDGGLEDAVDALLRPISLHIGPYVELFSGSQILGVLMFLQAPGSRTLSFTQNVTGSINEMLENSGLKVAEIDLDAFAACQGNPTDCFMVLMRFLIASLRLNRDALSDFTGDASGGVLDALFRHSDEWLLSTYIHLLLNGGGTELDCLWPAAPFTQQKADYNATVTKKMMNRALSGIDEVLGEFMADTTGDDLLATLSKTIYSNETLTQLAKTLYGAFSGEETAAFAPILGLPGSPAALAGMLSTRYVSARSALLRARSWDTLGTVQFGVPAGSRSAFEAALTALLQPVRPMLEAFLANGTLTVLGALRIGGTNGYNTAVIPLLEALSCPEDSIKPYDDYVRGKGTDRILTDVLDPLLDLVDQIIRRPVFRLTKLLPNLLYFVQNGGLSDCVEHLLAPLSLLLDDLSISGEQLGIDLSALESPDLSDLLASFGDTGSFSLPLDDIDFSLLASLGKATQVESKRTYNGKPVTVTYIKSDQKAVLLTLLRGIIDAIKAPENAGMLDEMISATGGDNAMFAQYSVGIGEQMADMTTDEVIAWLYQLLFRERATKEIKEDDGYVPDFPYAPAPSHTVRNVLLVVLGVLLLAGGAVLLWRRKEIAAWRARRKSQKLLQAEKEA